MALLTRAEEYFVHNECKVVHRNDDVLPLELVSDIATADYPEGDYHRIFCGEIMSVSAARGTRKYE